MDVKEDQKIRLENIFIFLLSENKVKRSTSVFSPFSSWQITLAWHFSRRKKIEIRKLYKVVTLFFNFHIFSANPSINMLRHFRFNVRLNLFASIREKMKKKNDFAVQEKINLLPDEHEREKILNRNSEIGFFFLVIIVYVLIACLTKRSKWCRLSEENWISFVRSQRVFIFCLWHTK